MIPYVGHNSVAVWVLLHPKGAKTDKPEYACLQRMGAFCKQALQGRQTSDLHSHEDVEQLYYILKGSAAMLIGGEKHRVKEGDVVYLPPKTSHQLINDGEEWVEYLIIQAPLA
ncbi:MAG: cupin domain-containing protein [Candidatus Bathyarchaeia archaeon]